MIYLAPLIAALYPCSKFIFIHRHPADVGRSGMRRGWYVDHPWDSARITPRQHDPALAQWSAWDQFEKVCWLWKEANEFIIEFLRTLSQRRVHWISFKALAQGRKESIESLFTFAGARFPAHASVVKTIATKHNAQRTGTFPEYSTWSPRERQMMAEIAGPTMHSLGYP